MAPYFEKKNWLSNDVTTLKNSFLFNVGIIFMVLFEIITLLCDTEVEKMKSFTFSQGNFILLPDNEKLKLS